MDFDYLKIFTSIILAVFGWILGHYFNTKRDKSLKKRELSTSYLISAYRVLANDISTRKSTTESNKKFEDLLSDIQLFGSLEQINMAKALAKDLANSGSYELDPLINNLRDELRKELELKAVKGNLQWFRFGESSH